MSEKSVILLEDICSSQAGFEWAVGASVTDAAISSFPLMPWREGCCWEKRGEECPVGRLERLVEEEVVCETEAGTKADVEDEDDDIVGGVPYVGVSGYESGRFTLSEIFHRKGFARENLFEGVVDTSQLPQCEFSNFLSLPLTS